MTPQEARALQVGDRVKVQWRRGVRRGAAVKIEDVRTCRWLRIRWDNEEQICTLMFNETHNLLRGDLILGRLERDD